MINVSPMLFLMIDGHHHGCVPHHFLDVTALIL